MKKKPTSETNNKQLEDHNSANYKSNETNEESEEQAREQTNLLFEEDKIWLQKVEAYIQSSLSNSHYTIRELAENVAISERQLRRQLKKLTGLSPAQYLKKIRLQQAYQFIITKKYKTISQVAYAVGFKDLGAFRENFKQMYGDVPSAYLKI